MFIFLQSRWSLERNYISGQIIPLHCMRLTYCDCFCFNKELSGQEIGRKKFSGTSGNREDLGKKKCRITRQMQRKHLEQYGDRR